MNIVVLGAGGHGIVVVELVLTQTDRFSLIGVLDSSKPVGTSVGASRVCGTESDLPSLITDKHVQGIVVAIGDNAVRQRVVERLRANHPSLAFPSVISTQAVVARGAVIRDACVVCHGAVIGAEAVLAEGCLVNTRASLDHNGRMEPFASLAPGVVTGGNVVIGSGAALCIGVVMVHGVSVGDGTVVGAGATVIRSLPAGVVAYGTPARVVRDRAPGDKYL